MQLLTWVIFFASSLPSCFYSSLSVPCPLSLIWLFLLLCVFLLISSLTTPNLPLCLGPKYALCHLSSSCFPARSTDSYGLLCLSFFLKTLPTLCFLPGLWSHSWPFCPFPLLVSITSFFLYFFLTVLLMCVCFPCAFIHFIYTFCFFCYCPYVNYIFCWISSSLLPVLVTCGSSALGGLSPSPAAGVPCPPPARDGHCGQAYQTAGQLLWSWNPKDGRLSLRGGH